ncbi:RnfABCDGE type electron transport complex subunit D [Candidatus Curtissbacteria bacterium]|nr:RnfABCDGE type electron transport complex subunit D [Candidatus Curtissbacteria bacterium]
MDWKVFFVDNRLKVAFTLFLVWLLAAWHFKTLAAFGYPLLAVGLVIIFDLLITWFRDKKLYWPFASLVTGFLIGLIIDPGQPLWIVALACLFASLSKQFISAGQRQHIFNPAAFGIIATSLIFGTPVSWWGIAWGKLPLVILIPLMIRILWGMSRIWLPIGFLVVYFTYLSVITKSISWDLFLDGTTLLFALVMLPEPITSPTSGKLKYLFGPLVALLAIFISSVRFLTDGLLPALLVGNLIGFLIIRGKIGRVGSTVK